MAINKPILDDRAFQDLMDEIVSLIPRYNHAYTNFNPSDPGITLLELFAWLADQLLYRLNRIPEESYRTMLQIVLGDLYQEEGSLESNIKAARLLLEETYRAVTSQDYIDLVMQKMDEIQTGLAGRVIIMNNLDLSYIPPGTHTLDPLKKTGHISVILIPRCSGGTEGHCNAQFLPAPVPSDDLISEIYSFLKERRLISTTIHVLPPSYVTIDVEAWLQLVSNVDVSKSIDDTVSRIEAYFDPVDGGSDGTGWPPGRSFHKSELYQLLEGSMGVDHVEKTLIKSDGVELTGSNSDLDPWEFISLGNVKINILNN